MPGRAILLVLAGMGGLIAQPVMRAIADDLDGRVNAVALSPIGDRVALSWCRGSGSEQTCGVYVRRREGGEPKLLFRPKELAHSLRWSPDGRWLAYIDMGWREGGVLYGRPIAGGEPRKIATICWGGYTWGGDSKALIARSGKSCAMRVFSLLGQQVATLMNSATGPSISPDGRLLAFVRDRQIFVQSLAAGYRPHGPARLVVREPNLRDEPVWIADGKELLYGVRDLQPLRRVAIAAGAKPRIVDGIDDQAELISLQAAGRGAAIAWVARHADAIWRIDLRANRPVLERIRATPHIESGHRVSGEGKQVLFLRNGALFRSDLAGTNAQRVCESDDVIWKFNLSSDGQWIAFSRGPSKGNADMRSRLYVVAAAGGIPKRLLPGREDVMFESWSRDGQRLYVSLDGPTRALWKLDWKSGALSLVTKDGGPAAPESVDGKWVYFATTPYSKRHRVPADGGAPQKLLGTEIDQGLAVGAQSLFFTASPRTGRTALLQRLGVYTGAVETITELPFSPRSLQLAAEERYLYLTSQPPSVEQHLLIDGLQ